MNAELLVMLGFVSIIFLAFVIFFLWLLQSLEMKLLALGLLTALLGVWCGQAGGSVHVGPGMAAEAGRFILGGETAASLGRIAFLLVLSAIALIILGRCGYPSIPVSPKETTHGNPI
jgi:hypothetical protein